MFCLGSLIRKDQGLLKTPSAFNKTPSQATNQMWCYVPVIPAMQKAMGRIDISGQPRQKCETVSEK
jgi:hypothetical protein